MTRTQSNKQYNQSRWMCVIWGRGKGGKKSDSQPTRLYIWLKNKFVPEMMSKHHKVTGSNVNIYTWKNRILLKSKTKLISGYLLLYILHLCHRILKCNSYLELLHSLIGNISEIHFQIISLMSLIHQWRHLLVRVIYTTTLILWLLIGRAMYLPSQFNTSMKASYCKSCICNYFKKMH